MATATEQQRHPDSPRVPHVTRSVGPIECQFVALREAPQAPHPIPTVESLAREARGMLGPKADAYPNMPEGQAEYRRRLLQPKPQREAAQAAVTRNQLRGTDGALLTRAALAPLVTAVRKELNQRARQEFRDQDTVDRARARAAGRADAAIAKAKERAVAKALAKIHCAVLPDGARPTKSTGKNRTTPVLEGAGIRKAGRGETATWELVTTDSYQLTRFPLTVHGRPGLVDGMVIGPEALKRVEQAGAFRITKQGLIQAVDYQHVRVHVEVSLTVPPVVVRVPVARDYGEAVGAMPHHARFPDTAQLWPKPVPPTKRIELTFNPDVLAKIGDSLTGRGTVTITLDERQLARGDDGVRRQHLKGGDCALRVRPGRARDGSDSLGITAIAMPVSQEP